MAKYVNKAVLNAVDSSTTALSNAIDGSLMYAISCQGVFTDSSSAGTLKLQASNDSTVDGNWIGPFVPTNWEDIPNATVSVTAGGAKLIPFTQTVYRWIRVSWTRSAGAGTLTATIQAMTV